MYPDRKDYKEYEDVQAYGKAITQWLEEGAAFSEKLRLDAPHYADAFEQHYTVVSEAFKPLDEALTRIPANSPEVPLTLLINFEQVARDEVKKASVTFANLLKFYRLRFKEKKPNVRYKGNGRLLYGMGKDRERQEFIFPEGRFFSYVSHIILDRSPHVGHGILMKVLYETVKERVNAKRYGEYESSVRLNYQWLRDHIRAANRWVQRESNGEIDALFQCDTRRVWREV